MLTSINIQRSLFGSNCRHPHSFVYRLLNYVSHEYAHEEKNPAPLFFNPKIQSLLKHLTRTNLNVVYGTKKLGDKRVEQPIYKFMTTEELQETLEEAKKRADDLLQMPPAVRIRKTTEKLLTKDPALKGLDNSKFVFTDVTFGKRNSERLIVIRESNGTLKQADWDVRDRMNQIYFPKTCRTLKTPRMFSEKYLQSLLNQKEYEFVLDRACAQFEPDHPDYQRVTSITYQHVNDHNDFEKLRSTRHFGSLTFFLTWHKNIDNLLLQLLETANIEEANSLLQLYEEIHDLKLFIENMQGTEGITRYVKEFAQKRGPLELALQAYKDLDKQRSELEKGIQTAHGLL